MRIVEKTLLDKLAGVTDYELGATKISTIGGFDYFWNYRKFDGLSYPVSGRESATCIMLEHRSDGRKYGIHGTHCIKIDAKNDNHENITKAFC